VQLDALLAVQHHGRVHVHGVAQVEHGGEGGDDGEGGQHLQVALVGELEVVGAAADAERVEHHVALAVGVRHRAELLADGLQIDWHAGYLTSLTGRVKGP